MRNKVPGLYFSLGVNKKGVTELQPGNHSPYFTIDDDALDQGFRSLVYLTLDYPEVQ
jgi:amidohydrolase